MAQTVKDAALDSRTARSRLAVRPNAYFRMLDEGVHLGYRRNVRGGVWIARLYTGERSYRVERIGIADDKADADGVAILSFAQAQAAARKMHVGAARHSAGMPALASGPYTVAMALADYLTWLEGDGRSKQASDDTRGKSNGLIVPKLGELRLDQLTSKQIEDWHHAMAKASPRLRVKAGAKQRHRTVDMGDANVRLGRRSTANRVLGILRAALNKAWRDGRTPDDSAWRKVKGFKGATQSRARYLTHDECRRLVNACEADFRDIVRAGLFTGCRWSELTRLAPGDFNPDAGTVTIRTSKSAKARHVVLAEDGVEFFEKAQAKAGGRAHLFVRDDGERWRTSWQIRPMVEASKQASIVPGVGFHVLRHTWASHAVMNGAPLMIVAKNLGHADTRMVEMHYGHLSPSYVTDEIRRTAPRFDLGSDQVVTPMRPTKRNK